MMLGARCWLLLLLSMGIEVEESAAALSLLLIVLVSKCGNGRPKGSTTRPIKAGPTRILGLVPVKTASAPTSGRSLSSNATATVFCSKSITSPCRVLPSGWVKTTRSCILASRRPLTRARAF